MTREAYIKRMEEMKAREESATPGPWEQHNWDPMERPHVVATGLWNGKDSCNGHFDVPCTSENTSFIAASRTDLPALRDALEIAVKTLERLSFVAKRRDSVECDALECRQALERIYAKVGGG